MPAVDFYFYSAPSVRGHVPVVCLFLCVKEGGGAFEAGRRWKIEEEQANKKKLCWGDFK